MKLTPSKSLENFPLFSAQRIKRDIASYRYDSHLNRKLVISHSKL